MSQPDAAFPTNGGFLVLGSSTPATSDQQPATRNQQPATSNQQPLQVIDS
jgi:hypothetical protein